MSRLAPALAAVVVVVLLVAAGLAQAGVEDCPPNDCIFVPLAIKESSGNAPEPSATATNAPTQTATATRTATPTQTATATRTATATPTTTTTPDGPQPGFYASTTGDEFYVSPDRTQVLRFAIYITLPAECGGGTAKITRQNPVPIVNSQFAFSGSFYASGTFTSATSASGTDGLSQFSIPNCGLVSGGPWNWTATWKNGSQPSPSTASGEIAAIVTVADHGGHKVTLVEQLP